jgi:hypothetical protein
MEELGSNRTNSLKDILSRWWRNWRGVRINIAALQRCGPDEVKRMAHDVGLDTHELRALAGKWPDSADQLNHRLRVIGLDAAEISAADPRVMRDLQRTCSMCVSKGRCTHDLARDENASGWREYCPNVATLDALKMESDIDLADKRMRRRLRSAGTT